jgi:hypothetical protein
MKVRSSAVLLSVVGVSLLASAASAQSVRGTVVDRQSGAPISGALIALVAEGGAVRGEVLSDAGGRFLLRARDAGRYTLRAQRIGYRTASSPALELAAGQVLDYRLQAAVERVALPAITASGSRRCTGTGGSDAEVVALWDEARKALASTSATTRQFPYRYQVRRAVRQLDASTLSTRNEETQTSEGYRTTPFVSVPIERLLAHGYVEMSGDTAVFHAPDALVLLSAPFLEAHCFRAQPADRDHRGMVGLAFQPVASNGRADVKGTLWLDAGTAELRVLEYGYTELPAGQDNTNVGGRVEFRRLPSGAWIVSRWRIRMPAAASPANRPPAGAAVPGTEVMQAPPLLEELGEVLEIRGPDGATVAMAARTRLSGVVYDSTRGRPLAGARVSLPGTAYAAQTDTAGRWVIPALPEGVYSLVFSHPRLDTLRYAPDPVRIAAVPPQPLVQDLAVPPLARVLAASCPAASEGTGAIAGVVTAGAEARPLAGVPVRAAWQRPGASGDTARVLSVSDDAGVYRFCGVPERIPVTLAVSLPGAPAPAEVRLPGGVPLQHDLALATAAAAPASTAGPAAAPAKARVTLRLLDAESSRPIAGATVRFGHGLPDATTDRNGRVQVADVPAGTYGVELQHETYGAGISRIAVRGSGAMELELRIPRRTVTLDPIAVDAKRVLPGYDTNRRGRHFDVITHDELVRRRASATTIADVVGRFPGIRIRPGTHLGSVCLETTRATPVGGALGGAAPAPALDARPGKPSAPDPTGGEAPGAGAGCAQLAIVVDDVPIAYGPSTEFDLGSISIEDIETIVFLRPVEAFAQYGYIAERGALLIYTKGNGPTAPTR